MAVTAHKCVEKGCKGYVVFDNADFNYERIPEVNGMYVFDNPCCSECEKEYKVVPSYAVLLVDEKGGFTESNSACINDFEKREKEREFENETDPYEKSKKVY